MIIKNVAEVIMESQRNETLRAALFYAGKGWHVFPLRAGTKEPATPHGFKDATTDTRKIETWWHGRSDLNIGIRTGSVSGIWVIDLDGPVGIEAWRDTGLGDSVGIVRTGRGGEHHFYRYPVDTAIGCRTAIVANVDVRGDGGFVVAAPSLHPNGKRYLWRSFGELAYAPAGAVELATRRAAKAATAPRADIYYVAPRGASTHPYGLKALENEIVRLRAQTEGGRNNALNVCAMSLGSLIGGNVLDRAHVELELTRAAHAIGLGEIETQKTIASGINAGMRQPRGVPVARARVAR